MALFILPFEGRIVKCLLLLPVNHTAFLPLSHAGWQVGERFIDDEVPRVASIRAVLGSWGEGWPPVNRYSGGGAVCHRGGCGPAQRHMHEEHSTLPEAAQTQVSISTGPLSRIACMFLNEGSKLVQFHCCYTDFLLCKWFIWGLLSWLIYFALLLSSHAVCLDWQMHMIGSSVFNNQPPPLFCTACQ